MRSAIVQALDNLFITESTTATTPTTKNENNNNNNDKKTKLIAMMLYANICFEICLQRPYIYFGCYGT